MSNKGDIPTERKLKRDYFMIGVYVLVALVMIIQFLVMFSIDIMDALGLNN